MRLEPAGDRDAPPPGIGDLNLLAVEIGLGLLAALMAVFTALVIRWAVEAEAPLQVAGVVFLLVMMAAMFGGAGIVYYLHPGTAGLVEGLWLAAGLMSLGAFIPFFTLLRSASVSPGP